MKLHATQKRDLYLCIFAIAIANTFVWITIGAFLGGVPHSANGRYYMNQHGRLTEVSRPVYLYAEVHSWFTLALILVGVHLGKKGMQLKRELEDYDPVTSRSI